MRERKFTYAQATTKRKENYKMDTSQWFCSTLLTSSHSEHMKGLRSISQRSHKFSYSFYVERKLSSIYGETKWKMYNYLNAF